MEEMLCLYLCDEWKSRSSLSLIGIIQENNSEKIKEIIKITIAELLKSECIQLDDNIDNLYQRINSEYYNLIDILNDIKYLYAVEITSNKILTDGTYY